VQYFNNDNPGRLVFDAILLFLVLVLIFDRVFGGFRKGPTSRLWRNHWKVRRALKQWYPVPVDIRIPDSCSDRLTFHEHQKVTTLMDKPEAKETAILN
jgi:hypothetical protein